MSAAEDRETRAAVAALVHRLRNRGDADDEPFAAEYVAALRARGWRPVLALPPGADWRRRAGAGAEPTEEYLAAKRALLARASGEQPALAEDNDRQET